MNKVCVIGGSGFLGSHVCDELSNRNYKVTIYDRKPSQWLRGDQKMVVADILDQEKLELAIEGADIVFNFAAIADLEVAMDIPVETVRVNILGNALILDACVKKQVKRYMYASTVYVQSRDGGFYRCSKHACEQYVEEYHRRFKLDYTILRYGSLYGPRADNSNGMVRIIKNALKTSKVSYAGNVEAMREYIHVFDAASASADALGEQFLNQHLVLTGQEPMRVYDLLKTIAEILDIKDPVEFLESSVSGHYVRTPYAYQTRLGKKLTCPVHVDLGQGLLDLIHTLKDDSH